MSGVEVRIFSGAPPRAPAGAVELQVGQAIPASYGALRQLIPALHAEDSPALDAVVRANGPEWNRIFPGGARGVADLFDLALTPSERRLHRESEQVFRVLNAAARALLDGIAGGRTLVLRGAGAADLVSLRGVMRAVEWSRLEALGGAIWLCDWTATPGRTSAAFAPRRAESLRRLAERMRAPIEETGAGGPGAVELEAVDLEGQYLRAALDEGAPAESRLAAALLAIRACFYNTQYDGALLAAEQGLELLDRGVKPEAVEAAFAQANDTSLEISTLEIDAAALGGPEVLRALLWRQVGHVHVFNGDFDAAFAAYDRALALDLPPERRAQARMYRALTLVKRLGQLEAARGELSTGLAGLKGRPGEDAALQAGWLHNLFALTYFMDKRLEPAREQEELAMAAMRGLRGPSASHLVTNLVSNISVLHEAGGDAAMALATWKTFEQVNTDWGQAFFKHQRYRRAALHRLVGDRDAALADLAEADRLSGELGDRFHRQAIAAELGRWRLDLEDAAGAERAFAAAVEHARAVGEPQRVGESLAGLAVARGERDFSEARRCLDATSTYPKDARKLAEAIAGGDPDRIRSALPAPRSKLNRPFDPVNL